jgi:hypothetical protein
MLMIMRFDFPVAAVLMLALTACSGEIYVRDGVTDGDTFYLADRALSDDDPVLQSWVSYSLTRSTCQLQIGGENPARASSFECELTARRLMLETWHEKTLPDASGSNTYMNELAAVQDAGFLDEYVAHHYRRRHWQLPDDMEVPAYRSWSRQNIPNHAPQTRIIGSWNYQRNVSAF